MGLKRRSYLIVVYLILQTYIVYVVYKKTADKRARDGFLNMTKCFNKSSKMCMFAKNCEWHYRHLNKYIDLENWVSMKELIDDQYNKSLHIPPVQYEHNIANTVETRKSIKKYILMVVFSEGDAQSLGIINRNMKNLIDFDWAIILYKNVTVLRSQFCETASIVKIAKYRNIAKMKGFIPKPLLYQELLDIVLDYKWVWLLDSDISADEFDIHNFIEVLEWTQGSINGPPPLILQPLGRNTGYHEYRKYLCEITWADNKHVQAAYVPFIEQGFPIIDALFFNWLTTNIIKPFNPLIENLETDWGFDTHWCKIARDFQNLRNMTIKYKKYQDLHPCAVIVKSSPLVHQDSRLIRFISRDLGQSYQGSWRFCMKGMMMADVVWNYIKSDNAVPDKAHKMIAPPLNFTIDDKHYLDFMKILNTCKHGFMDSSLYQLQQDDYYWELLRRILSDGSRVLSNLRLSPPQVLLNNPNPKRLKLLCIVTLSHSRNALHLLQRNIVSSRRSCDWAVMFSQEVESEDVAALRSRFPSDIVYTGTPVSYSVLVPTAKKYERIWMLLEDADLSKISFKKLMSVLEKHQNSPYLVFEPLIVGKSALKTVATRMPIVDSNYFAWYVKHVEPLVEVFQSNQLWNRLLCPFAAYYSSSDRSCSTLTDVDFGLQTLKDSDSDVLQTCIQDQTSSLLLRQLPLPKIKPQYYF